MSVTVPSVEFFTVMVAPINGSPLSLVIVPFTVVCAYAEPQHRNPTAQTGGSENRVL